MGLAPTFLPRTPLKPENTGKSVVAIFVIVYFLYTYIFFTNRCVLNHDFHFILCIPIPIPWIGFPGQELDLAES